VTLTTPGRRGAGGRLPVAVPVPVAPAPPITCAVTANPLGLDPAALYGVARRHNARRSALFVSRVLGKHVPASPATIALAGELLAARVARPDRGWPFGPVDLGDPGPARARLGADRPLWPDATVISFAETATALGHLVRDGLGAATFLHTTRAALDEAPLLAVEEEHSHATSHRLHHRDPTALAADGPVVLVDDELTTGRTMLNTITALHAHHPRPRYVVAALLDWRDDASRSAFDATAQRLGTPIDVVALVTGEVDGALVDGPAPAEPGAGSPVPAAGPARRLRVALPVPPTARRGWTPTDQDALDEAVPAVADRLAGALVGDGRVLCVGTEELMYVPLRIAERLASLVSGPVHYQSTTRSPVVVADVDGYPVRHGLRFAHHDEPHRLGRLYNVAPGAQDDIVVFVEGPCPDHRLAPMVGALAGTGSSVHVVELVPAP
jgi:hypothetical protein